jgi:membrane protein YqaA with SNARE-associated domain
MLRDTRAFSTRDLSRQLILLAGDFLRPLIRIVGLALFRAGGLGIFTLSAFDSSPLVVPLGNDLLILALSARYHNRMLYYVVMATLGSLLGSAITIWLSRKGGDKLQKVAAGRKLYNIQKFVQEHAAWTLVSASLLPPPFPFTPVVGAAAAFKYPGKKLFTYIGVGRFLRFLIEGALAIHYGRWIIRQARSPVLEYSMIALIVISIVASVLSVYKLSHKGSRTSPQAA